MYWLIVLVAMEAEILVVWPIRIGWRGIGGRVARNPVTPADRAAALAGHAGACRGGDTGAIDGGHVQALADEVRPTAMCVVVVASPRQVTMGLSVGRNPGIGSAR
jgi:hypothetical protein